MSLIVGTNITHSYSDADVLRNASFVLAPSERVGLVGPNGSGKTTLLRILAGLMTPVSGDLQRRKDLAIGYLPQDPPEQLSSASLRECMLEVFADVQAMEAELADLADRLADGGEHDESALARYGTLQTQYETAGGYDYTQRVDTILSGLGFEPDQFGRPLEQLSGGQKTRALLGRLLLEEPDVLLLDEPTNHLDLHAVEWLERYLAEFSGAAVVVSHDRYFLDRATNRTWEVCFASLESFKGSYTTYVRQREERFAERTRQWQAQQAYIANTEDFIRRNLAGQRTKEAQGRRTRLERFLKTEAIPQPQRPPTISLSLPAPTRTGDRVLQGEELTVGYDADTPLVKMQRLNVDRGDRIAILGGNGTGKTTLLRTLMGQIDPLAGSFHWGANVRCGYLSQAHENLDGDRTALRNLIDNTGCSDETARDALGAMLISGDDALKPVRELSGGQRSRVSLAQIALEAPNVLLLDEPTNHLDLPSRETLQDVLAGFAGTILFVSHDRYLVQHLATHIWAIDHGQLAELRGGWDAYLAWRADRAQRRAAAQARAAGTDEAQALADRQARKQSYEQTRQKRRLLERLTRRHEELEHDIHRLEEQLETLNADISAASEAGDLQAVERLGRQYQQTQDDLSERMDEWEAVGEQIEAESD